MLFKNKDNSKSKTFISFKVVIIALVALVAGCEEPFQPLEENDQYFYSIYGFLDATADTQWVRIMPVRETTDYSDEPIDATATLTELETGEEVIVNDSLFSMPQVAPGDALIWNFWTTFDIKPSHAYSLVVERSDGAVSKTTVNIPDDYPEPVVEGRYISLTGVNNIAEARIDWKVRDRRDDTIHLFRILQHRIKYFQDDDEYLITVYPNVDFTNEILETLEADQVDVEILDTKAVITVAGKDWIDFSELDRSIIALPQATSNIENGVGYFVGTIRKTIPFPVCVGDFGEIVSCQSIID
ncbi:hypothetical protein [Gracilimonas sp.]|uniref:hypothetical protein n=1 Tax=Gracilimonas sp. TaxID=1974203 RepID=UPI002870EA91|nr:hypothetical protein [Gracilimonas sp.]